jgi:HD-like signal output (HDOD) protein
MAESLASVDLESVEKIHAVLVDRIAKDELNLSLLPHVATEVLNLSSDSDANMVKLPALIQQDQATARQVMKISNSDPYALFLWFI